MSTRLWYPDDLIDELLPEGRETPEAWLYFLHPGDGDLDAEGRFLARHYKPGAYIAFRWCERRGRVTLSIAPDGTLAGPARCPGTLDFWSREPDPPQGSLRPDVNSFWDYDTEIHAETAEDFAAYYAEAVQPLDPAEHPLQVSVEIAVWSEKITFIIDADGRSLTPVAPTAVPEEAKP